MNGNYTIYKRVRTSTIVTCCLAVLIVAAGTNESLGQDTENATVRIQSISLGYFGWPVDVAITLENPAPDFEMGGFDFLFGYDPAAISLMSVTQGELLNSCEWEYFNYRSGLADSCLEPPCPNALVRIVALADINNGSVHPQCYANTPGELAVLNFRITTNHEYECQFTHVRWFWMDCGDNSVASRYGDTLYLSEDVFDPWGTPVSQDTTFPTALGAPDDCVDGTLGSGVRAIDFINGGIDIQCPETLGTRGDINLNGLSYELADYQLFANYFLYGLSVFTINVEQQIANTDINADGVVLTFQDLIYLFRIIIGETLPFPAPPTAVWDTALLIQDTADNRVALDYPDSLSALYLTFDGQIAPTTDLPDHYISYNEDESPTRMLLLPDFDFSGGLPIIPSGIIFEYTGEANLVSAEATYDGTVAVPTDIQYAGITCCEVRGNVDGVVGPSGPIDVGDLSYLVAYLFTGGPLPPCEEEGNVDALTGSGGSIDVNDLTYLVDYLFRGGPPPPAC